jgi:hypothetical protein
MYAIQRLCIANSSGDSNSMTWCIDTVISASLRLVIFHSRCYTHAPYIIYIYTRTTQDQVLAGSDSGGGDPLKIHLTIAEASTQLAIWSIMVRRLKI